MYTESHLSSPVIWVYKLEGDGRPGEDRPSDFPSSTPLICALGSLLGQKISDPEISLIPQIGEQVIFAFLSLGSDYC